jgi:molybdopterin synthase catalytic subunit
MEDRPLAGIVAITDDPIDPTGVLDSVRHPAAGAVCLFLGTVRDHAPGRTAVTHLEYEAYREEVEGVIGAVVGEAAARWPLTGASVVHRVGSLPVGEVSVAAGASAAHRADAFAAARYLIDEVKARAPIWKKEHWDGGAEWVREGPGEA